jgi:hypothetical protein
VREQPLAAVALLAHARADCRPRVVRVGPAARNREVLRDRAEPGVGVRVAEGVAELEVAAQALRPAEADDLAVLDGDDLAPGLA